MRNFLSNWWPILLLVIGAVLLIIPSLICDGAMMEQCLEDGKKEYECYGLIHGGHRR